MDSSSTSRSRLRVAALAMLTIMPLSGCAVAARALGAAEALSTVYDLVKPALAESSDGPSSGAGHHPTAQVVGTDRTGLWLNGRPGGERLRLVGDGEVVTLLCYAPGPSISGPYNTTSIWDRVRTSDGATGYMTDAYLATGSNEPVVGPC